MDTIGGRIRVARERRGLTQPGLGELLGTDGTSVSHWERGVRVPRTQRLVELAAALGVRVTWLLTGAGRVSA